MTDEKTETTNQGEGEQKADPVPAQAPSTITDEQKELMRQAGLDPDAVTMVETTQDLPDGVADMFGRDRPDVPDAGAAKAEMLDASQVPPEVLAQMQAQAAMGANPYAQPNIKHETRDGKLMFEADIEQGTTTMTFDPKLQDVEPIQVVFDTNMMLAVSAAVMRERLMMDLASTNTDDLLGLMGMRAMTLK